MMRQLTSLPFMSCGFRAGSIGSFQLQTLNSIAATERSFGTWTGAACQLVMFLGSVDPAGLLSAIELLRACLIRKLRK